MWLRSIAIARVTCSFNNTHVCITTIEGETILSGYGGNVGFKGHKRSTSYAALNIAKFLAKKVYKKGILPKSGTLQCTT